MQDIYSQKELEKILTIIILKNKTSDTMLTFPTKKLRKINQEISDEIPNFTTSLVKTSFFVEMWIKFYFKHTDLFTIEYTETPNGEVKNIKLNYEYEKFKKEYEKLLYTQK